MINYVDILYSVSKVLKENFKDHNILISENEEEIFTNTFSIRIMPISSERSFSKTFKVVSVIIIFINPQNDIEENIKTMQTIENLFDRYISIQGKKKPRNLPIFQKDYLTNNKIQFVLNYYEDGTLDYDSTYDALMEIINMNIYINDKQTTNIVIERKDE